MDKKIKSKYPKLAEKAMNITKKQSRNSKKSPTYDIIGSKDGKGGPGTMPTITQNLYPGMSGAEVTALQEWLIGQGYDIPAGATGYFGTQTQKAVSDWQKENGVDTGGYDGYFGPKSRAAMSGNQQEITPENFPTSSQKNNNGEIINPTKEDVNNFNNAFVTTSYKPQNAALVRFTDDPNAGEFGDNTTVWLVDKDTKVMRPFMSTQALMDYYGEDFNQAQQSIKNMSPSDVTAGGMLSSYTFLDENYGIYNGGEMNPLDFTPSDMKLAYTNKSNAESNSTAAGTVDGWLSYLLQNSNNIGIDSKTIQSILNDKMIIGGYINAIAYGGYTPEDIFMDIKRRDMMSKGDNSMANYRIIDPSVNKDTYMTTSKGSEAYTKFDSMVPGQIGSLTRFTFNSKAAQMPEEFYQATFPEYFDINSTEFKTKMEDVKSAAHDVILNYITAKTDAEKAMAENDWNTYKTQLEKNYNIKLSDNALEAWNQIQTIENTMSQAGLSGSGLERESVDKSIQAYRTTGDRERDVLAATEADKKKLYYQTYGSPEEIQKLNDEDMAAGLPRNQWRSVLWGLAPAEPYTQGAFIDEFRQKYPDVTLSNKEIADKYYTPYYDDNGNYRSTTYQTQATNKFKAIYGYEPGTVDTGLKEYQSNKVIEQGKAQLAKDEAWKTPADPFANEPQPVGEMPKSVVKKTDTITTQPQTTTQSYTPNIVNVDPETYKRVQEATAKTNSILGTNISATPTNNVQTQSYTPNIVNVDPETYKRAQEATAKTNALLGSKYKI